MSDTVIPTAESFREAFVGSFEECRKTLKQVRTWAGAWPRWNELMLAQLIISPELRVIQRSVLVRTAEAMGLSYWKGQPLTVDAIFSYEGSWFPILAAIEHENDWRGFESEVMKLLSVRCPLKVGITYAADRNLEACCERVTKNLQGDLDDAKSSVGEDPVTQYLLLIGGESEGEDISCWYSLDFRAGELGSKYNFRKLKAKS